MHLLRIPLIALVYFSIATVAAEMAAIGALIAKGNLQHRQLYQLLAVAHDVDLYATWKKMELAARPIQRSQISYNEVSRVRDALALDFDLREVAVEKGLNDMRQLQASLTRERERYDLLRSDFESRLEQLRKGAVDQAVLDVQRQLEAVTPNLAKDQIVRILDDPALDPDEALQFVVTIVKAMPFDKRKKVLTEFKNQDIERLHDILRQIRLGVPDVQLIRDTRAQLAEFISRQ